MTWPACWRQQPQHALMLHHDDPVPVLHEAKLGQRQTMPQRHRPSTGGAAYRRGLQRPRARAEDNHSWLLWRRLAPQDHQVSNRCCNAALWRHQAERLGWRSVVLRRHQACDVVPD